jgi:hypothetical protein
LKGRNCAPSFTVLVVIAVLMQNQQMSDLELLLIAIGFAFTAFWIWMLVDCAIEINARKKKYIIWFVAIAITHCIGAFVYFVLARKKAHSRFS